MVDQIAKEDANYVKTLLALTVSGEIRNIRVDDDGKLLVAGTTGEDSENTRILITGKTLEIPEDAGDFYVISPADVSGLEDEKITVTAVNKQIDGEDVYFIEIPNKRIDFKITDGNYYTQ